MSAFHPLQTPAKELIARCVHKRRILGIGSVALGLAFALECIWPGQNSFLGSSENRTRESGTDITMPSPNSATFNVNSDRPSILVSTITDAERASHDLINQAGHSCEVVISLSPIARVESGGTMHRVSCSNGKQYVVVLSENKRLRFLSSCADFTGQLENNADRCRPTRADLAFRKEADNAIVGDGHSPALL